jgi:hypothetical protein
VVVDWSALSGVGAVQQAPSKPASIFAGEDCVVYALLPDTAKPTVRDRRR